MGLLPRLWIQLCVRARTWKWPPRHHLPACLSASRRLASCMPTVRASPTCRPSPTPWLQSRPESRPRHGDTCLLRLSAHGDLIGLTPANSVPPHSKASNGRLPWRARTRAASLPMHTSHCHAPSRRASRSPRRHRRPPQQIRVAPSLPLPALPTACAGRHESAVGDGSPVTCRTRSIPATPAAPTCN